jgi:hypothetical protein
VSTLLQPPGNREVAAMHSGPASEVALERESHLISRLATSGLWMACFGDSEGILLTLSWEVPRTA